MTSTQITEMLEGVMPGRAYHHAAPEGSIPCLVWDTTGYKYTRGDNGPVLRARRFVVNLLTQTDDDPVLSALIQELARRHVAFSDPESSYDAELAVIVHSINCEALCRG